MPEEEYAWLRRADLLTFEEIQRLVEVFTELGVDKVRLTGGEPLAPPRPAGPGPPAGDRPGRPRPRHDEQRRPARRPGGGAPRRPASTASRSASTPCVRSASGRSRGGTITPPCCGGSRPSGRPGSRASSSTPWSSGGSTRTSWSTSWSSPGASTPRCGSSSTWTWGARRTGRGSRWSPARRCSSAWPRGTGRSSRSARRRPRPAERFRLPRRHDVRHHRLDDDAVLPDLRPEPAHGRRHLVPLPLRAAGRGPPDAPPGRRVARRAPGPHRAAAGHGAGIAAPRSGRSSRPSGIAGSWSRSRGCGRIRASRCTRAAAERAAARPSGRPPTPALTPGAGVARLLPS